MRLATALLVLALAAPAGAVPVIRPRPARPIDAPSYARLLEATRKERFVTEKLEQLRTAGGCGAWLFSGGQVLGLLETFAFWTDRIEALRLLPVVDRPSALEIARYFEPAPPLFRSEARRLLALED